MAEKTVHKQAQAYAKLVEAGVTLVKYWALMDTIIPDHIKVLSALLSFVDASFYSDKPRKAKTDAIGLALRAAYLYGKYDGIPQEPNEEGEAVDPQENPKNER